MKKIQSFYILIFTVFNYFYLFILVNFLGSFLASSPEIFNSNMKNIFKLPSILLNGNLFFGAALILFFLTIFFSLNYFLVKRYGQKNVLKAYFFMLLSLCIPFVLFSILGNN